MGEKPYQDLPAAPSLFAKNQIVNTSDILDSSAHKVDKSPGPAAMPREIMQAEIFKLKQNIAT